MKTLVFFLLLSACALSPSRGAPATLVLLHDAVNTVSKMVKLLFGEDYKILTLPANYTSASEAKSRRRQTIKLKHFVRKSGPKLNIEYICCRELEMTLKIEACTYNVLTLVIILFFRGPFVWMERHLATTSDLVNGC